jgi:hypothetical protein
MRRRNLPLAIKNLTVVARNRLAKWYRHLTHKRQRTMKSARETTKALRASARGTVDAGRDASSHAYSGTVRTARYWTRVHQQITPRLAREIAVRRELRAVARGNGPIIVGPWLSEVGYEVLYWVPFLRWFRDRYDVDPSRVIVVSRGGVAGWYRGIGDRYVELLDLFDVATFASRNAERQRQGEQKQHAITAFDREIVTQVQTRLGVSAAHLCHPSAMFRLLRHFWLGNESLQYVQDYMKYALVDLGPVPDVPRLPERFVAMKFYTGKAIPGTGEHRALLRQIVERVAADGPIVNLDTGLAVDEHEDVLFGGIAGVSNLAAHLTPQRNLAVQTAVIQRATAFVGTCGGLAWLAPFLGTKTIAVYADDDWLTPHLYAAHQAYRMTGVASFATVDLKAYDGVGFAVRSRA